MTDISLTSEKWIALLAIFLVMLSAMILTFRRRYQEKNRQHAELQNAYRLQEKEVAQRTQRLRAANNELYLEIDQHQLTEKKLRQTQDYLGSIINSMPSILISVTAEGMITHWNTRAEQATGHKERDALGRYLWDVYPTLSVDLSMIRDAIEQKTPKTKESHKQVVQGETCYQDIAVYPLISKMAIPHATAEAIIQVDDVTARVMMENMMIQNEKMMSLGELAAGMAHEINNPLSAILQSVQNIERRTSSVLPANQSIAERTGTDIDAVEKYLEERQIKKFLKNIRDAGERSARIVSNMLNFSHKSYNHSEVDINSLAKHCLELTENNFKIRAGNKKIKINIESSFDPLLPKVICSPAEIQQVILNLLRNASQSFIANEDNSSLPNKPTIHVSTSTKDESILIKVRDNGLGIPEEIRRHIFEPFFTTKEVGKGTGLGLSISYFIITEHHHGSIDVESAPDSGTEFTISLPCPKVSDTQPSTT